VNCCVALSVIDRSAGVTAIDTSAAGPTVRVALPVTPPEVAVIWAVPCVAPLATPLDVIGATLVFDELHETVLVTS
jgi:hypothetical protein